MVDIVPNIVFKTRVKDNDCTDCPNPYKWEDCLLYTSDAADES